MAPKTIYCHAEAGPFPEAAFFPGQATGMLVHRAPGGRYHYATTGEPVEPGDIPVSELMASPNIPGIDALVEAPEAEAAPDEEAEA